MSGLTVAAEVSVYFPCASVRPLRVFPGGREGGALMTGAAVRESVKVAGLVARVVRAFADAGAVLGPGHPCEDDAVLLASELSGIASGIAARVFPGRRSR